MATSLNDHMHVSVCRPHSCFEVLKYLPGRKWPTALVCSLLFGVVVDPFPEESEIQRVADLGAHEQSLYPPSAQLLLAGGLGAGGRGRKPVTERDGIPCTVDDALESFHENEMKLDGFLSISFDGTDDMIWKVSEADLDPRYREFLLDGHRDVGPLPWFLDLFVLGI